MHMLFVGEHAASSHFLSNIRAYNAALQFASTGLGESKEVVMQQV
jgi:hypothetical protein